MDRLPFSLLHRGAVELFYSFPAPPSPFFSGASLPFTGRLKDGFGSARYRISDA